MDIWERAARQYETQSGRELTAEGPVTTYGVPVRVGSLVFIRYQHYQAGDEGRVTFLESDKGEIYLGAD
jgi:hypothetical protein